MGLTDTSSTHVNSWPQTRRSVCWWPHTTRSPWRLPPVPWSSSVRSTCLKASCTNPLCMNVVDGEAVVIVLLRTNRPSFLHACSSLVSIRRHWKNKFCVANSLFTSITQRDGSKRCIVEECFCSHCASLGTCITKSCRGTRS